MSSSASTVRSHSRLAFLTAAWIFGSGMGSIDAIMDPSRSRVEPTKAEESLSWKTAATARGATYGIASVVSSDRFGPSSAIHGISDRHSSQVLGPPLVSAARRVESGASTSRSARDCSATSAAITSALASPSSTHRITIRLSGNSVVMQPSVARAISSRSERHSALAAGGWPTNAKNRPSPHPPRRRPASVRRLALPDVA